VTTTTTPELTLLLRAVADARALARAIDGGLLDRIEAHSDGLTALRYEASVAAGDHADPTATKRLHDPAAAHLAEIRSHVTAAHRILDRAHAIARQYPPVRVAGDAERAMLGEAEVPHCASCARIPGPDGQGRWEPAWPALASPTSVKGRLTEALWLCSWCYGRVRQWGRLPVPAELELHHQGKRVVWPSDVERNRPVADPEGAA
jgi:hypothetical protein